MSCFWIGSLRRQIAALAIVPIGGLLILAAASDWLLRDDLESVSYARTTALKIETVVDQIRASTSPEQEAFILEATSHTDLRVEKVAVAELSEDETHASVDDVRLLVRENLPASLVTTLRAKTLTGKLHDVLVVLIDTDRALAFLPAPPPADAWISDQQVSIVLELMVLVLPVALLSLYAARVISAPLLDFAKSAETLKPDDGPDRPFKEHGAAEIQTLARSLNDMRSRLRSMIDDRTRMLRAISHDLRTPLTRLRLRAERSTQPELKAALLEDISVLNDMINDTLTYLSTDMAAEKPVNADLPSLLSTVCSDFSDVGFEVRYVGPERFAYGCKPRSLARAITNLVENGTKFADEITVELSVLSNGIVRLSVVDDGPGIPSGLRARVLEPFFKADAARTLSNRSGFGLGLSIVDDIVRAHGGTIELLSNVPHGLWVQIELPAPGDWAAMPSTSSAAVKAPEASDTVAFPA